MKITNQAFKKAQKIGKSNASENVIQHRYDQRVKEHLADIRRIWSQSPILQDYFK